MTQRRAISTNQVVTQVDTKAESRVVTQVDTKVVTHVNIQMNSQANTTVNGIEPIPKVDTLSKARETTKSKVVAKAMKSRMTADEISGLLQSYTTTCRRIIFCDSTPFVLYRTSVCDLVQFGVFAVEHQIDIDTDNDIERGKFLRYFTSIVSELAKLTDSEWIKSKENFSDDEQRNNLQFVKVLQDRFNSNAVTDFVATKFLSFLQQLMEAAHKEYSKMDFDDTMKRDNWCELKVIKLSDSHPNLFVPYTMKYVLRMHCLPDWYEMISPQDGRNSVIIKVPTKQLHNKLKLICEENGLGIAQTDVEEKNNH